MIWIFSVDDHWRIGYSGDMLFAIPEDLTRFKELTWGHVMLMGRRTYEAIPVRPLPGRDSLVLSRDPDFQPEGVDVARSKEEALQILKEKYPGRKVFCIGGGEIARMFLPQTKAAYITHVRGEFSPYDTELPDLTQKGFVCKEKSEERVWEEYHYHYAYYERSSAMQLRENIDDRYKWDLTPIFKTEEDFEAAFAEIGPLVEELSGFAGRLLESPESLEEAITKYLRMQRKLEHLYVYSSLVSSLDTSNTAAQSRSMRMQALHARALSELAFFEPELLSAPKEKVLAMIEENKGLQRYTQYLENHLRYQEHVLSEKEEKILASLVEVTQAPGRTFALLNDADMTFPTVQDSEGNDFALSHGTFIRALESPDRVLRENAFKGFYSSFLSHKNTIASTLTTRIKAQGIEAKLRGFSGARAASLHTDNIPESVYDNLIESVHRANPAMYKYLRLRKQALGLDELHFYDLYVPLVKDVDMEIPFDQGMEDVIASMAPLGEEYQNLLRRAFDQRWIDVYETKGKRSGAFSSGGYDTPPYLLLNYQPNLDNVFTLAHELGHSMHSFLTRQNQPYVYGDYSIFLAEIASTFNEALLSRYYLDKITDPAQRLYLINHQLDTFKGTIFRQTMFAEFQRNINALSEAGESLTHERMAQEYEALLREYFSDEVVIDEEIRYEWSRIPHFYYNFYVFQYATGLSASTAFAKKVLEGEDNALENYLGFLSAGSSKYAVDVLKDAGVDMSQPETVDAALSVFTELVDEFERLLKELQE